ncbi:MAG: type II toxin-antitoxin system HicB family antitoxin [archaeon]|nr:type II toxin-antitoxin system HicB family antitoxin [archaeon]
MKVKEFDVVIEKDNESGQFYASVPALAGCYSYAGSIEALMKGIKEAIELHLSVLKSEKIKVDSSSVIGMVKVVV